MLLPITLLAAVTSFLVFAQAQQQLSLDTVVDLDSSKLPSPPSFKLPSDSNSLYVAIALCTESDSPPRFFVTNDTTFTQPGPGDVDNVSVFEVIVGSEGFGSWAGLLANGGILSVQKGSTTTPFEVVVSANNATSESDYPHVGDTTSNQALIFSPPFSLYPNYTLPSANLSLPEPPSNPSNYSLVFANTSSPAFKSLPRTTCAIRAAALQGSRTGVDFLTANQSQGLWLRDQDGWRWQWFVGGLTPRTNYTAYTLQNGMLTASKPINFVTKSASFDCPLVHNLPFCPSVSYAVPLAPPRAPATAHTASTIPHNIGDTITSIMANFTTTLTTLACGRDHYSPLVTCADCQQAYRTWLCAVSFPRCGETPASSSSITSTDSQAQVPLPALQSVKAGATPRNPILPVFSSAYETLLPCLETCNAVDRACPAFLGFKCPLPRFTASSSYGVGFVDSGDDGEVGGGQTGVAQDVYGNVWCNTG
ncbi:stretch-activated cation channel Mid1 [Cerioporus squamosus]|nr:stretch-activated cation channel Mid1 [Cerioporus squamosus]